MARRGRKPLGPEAKSEQIFARLTVAQKIVWHAAGGAAWLRAKLAEYQANEAVSPKPSAHCPFPLSETALNAKETP